MTPIRNAAAIYAKLPTDFPIPGEHVVYDESATIDLDTVEIDGSVLAKLLWAGIDPYIRTNMRPETEESYMPALKTGKPVEGFAVVKIIRSESDDMKAGDIVYAWGCPFQEYPILQKGWPRIVLKDEGIPLSRWLGAAGMPGQTAWIGWKALAHAKAGQTAYVTISAGAVGSLICQLAKNDGLRVISSAGSDEKVKFLKEELGVDYAFNYKTEDVESVLKQHGPIDVYWDGLGGKSVEIGIDNAKTFGRIICAGYTGEYNSPERYGIKNSREINRKSLTLSGFVFSNLMQQVGDFNFYQEVPKLVLEGKYKMNEYVVDGLKDTPQAIYDVLKGAPNVTGKAVIKVADE